MHFDNGGSGSFNSEINITPLVDVVLVLLIIFMVVAPLLMEGYDVSIPRTSTDSVAAQAEEAQLILSVGPEACPILEPPTGEGVPADCSVMLADQKMRAAEVPARVAEFLEAHVDVKFRPGFELVADDW